MILKNALRCKHCGDVIESTSVHDFKWCSCHKVAVDGGHEYLRRCANSLDDFEDLSETVPDEDNGDVDEDDSDFSWIGE